MYCIKLKIVDRSHPRVFSFLILQQIQLAVSRRVVILFALLFFSSVCSAQKKIFRRHFLIAYDVSTPFKESEKATPEYKIGLADLFSIGRAYLSKDSNQYNLNAEKKNHQLFFDKKNDEISFYHFNIAAGEMAELRSQSGYKRGIDLALAFNKVFIKEQPNNWSSFKDGHKNADVKDYINSILDLPMTPPNFGAGVSMSNFVYPLILNQVDTTQYAEEYILIILSDFLTGSELGNKMDLNRVNDIFQVPYSAPLTRYNPVYAIKNQLDELNPLFDKLSYFEYEYKSRISSSSIAIIGYKIKPKAGSGNSDDASVFIDGDLGLSQNGYGSTKFTIRPVPFKFNHNNNLFPNRVRLETYLRKKGGEIMVSNDTIATLDTAGHWQSKLTTDSRLMEYNKAGLTYYIPRVTIKLDTTILEKDFDNLQIRYKFDTRYQADERSPVNFIYTAERTLPIENIEYTPKINWIMIYSIIAVAAILLLIYFTVNYGKPLGLDLNLSGFVDSYEVTDYRKSGKFVSPFKGWDTKKNKVDYLMVKGAVDYKKAAYKLNWDMPISLSLIPNTVPKGVELFLKPDIDHAKEFAADYRMRLAKDIHGEFSFVVGVRQNGILEDEAFPMPVKFTVEAKVADSKLFFLENIYETISYSFYIGADLKDVWVGLDPGTTGSCIAVGSESNNIILGKGKGEQAIIPSILSFDRDANFQQSIDEKDLYEYGTNAEKVYANTTRYASFQSIKKLLGFKDIKQVAFKNKNIISLNGKELASQLVKGLFGDLHTYINRPGFKADAYKRDGIFKPLRAVVAIPNNFTIVKIQDMIDCVRSLNQFIEIRYVYEAEAVLFYYMANYGKLNKKGKSLEAETVLVFDMGGATINTTIVKLQANTEKNSTVYDVDFLGKIGYGIGGDSIDYCIIKFILSWENIYPGLKAINAILNTKKMPDEEKAKLNATQKEKQEIKEKEEEEKKKATKIKLTELALFIKMEIISNLEKGYDYLISDSVLQTYISTALDITIVINDDSKMYKYFVKGGWDATDTKLNYGKLWGNEVTEFGLFKHPLFYNIVYKNVCDAVNEVFEIAGSPAINKLVFSGRSTIFPMIKETVKQQLKMLNIAPEHIVFTADENKTAVAKGACWYGLNKDAITLNNLKTNAAFGFSKIQVAGAQPKFYELVEMGRIFDTRIEEISFVKGSLPFEDKFALDGAKVNFYQVMGKNAKKILESGQNHKFSKVATIRVEKPTTRVEVKVNENDEVQCAIVLNTNQAVFENGVVADQEVMEANNEHYTWIVD